MKRDTAIGAFRGLSGEVVASFLRPATLVSSIPVLAALAVCSIVPGLVIAMAKPPLLFVILLSVLATSPVTGVFVMAARAGNLKAGFFECLMEHRDGALAFTFRHVMLAFAWGSIVWGLSHLLGGSLALSVLGLGSPRAALWTALLVLTVLVLLGAPLASLLIAARAESTSDLLSLSAWRWVLVERWRDVLVLVASCVGALLVGALLVGPVLVLLVALAFYFDPAAGVIAATWVWMLPAAMSPILLGRIAGAFAVSDDLLDEADLRGRPAPGAVLPGAVLPGALMPGAGGPLAAGAPAAPGPVSPARPAGAVSAARPVAPPTPPAVVPAVGPALARLREQAEDDLPAALAEALKLMSDEPRHPGVRALVASLLARSERLGDALPIATEAVRLALAGGAGPVAAEVLEEFAEQAGELDLTPREFTQLARVVLGRGDFDVAAWCHRQAARTGEDPVAVQKGLVATAEAASAASKPRTALTILESLLSNYPDSPFEAHVQGQIQALRRKVNP